MTRTLAVFVLLLLAPAWLRAGPMEDFQRKYGNDGRRYKEALVEAIKASDRIVVTEHSDRNDFPLSERNRTDLPQFEYSRVELDGPAKAKFLKNAETMDDKTKTTATACIFVPHHAVKFYFGAELKSTMQICFHCGDIHWNAVNKGERWLIPPNGLWTAILPLIKDAGFHMDREQEVWVARLEEQKSGAGKMNKANHALERTAPAVTLVASSACARAAIAPASAVAELGVVRRRYRPVIPEAFKSYGCPTTSSCGLHTASRTGCTSADFILLSLPRRTSPQSHEPNAQLCVANRE